MKIVINRCFGGFGLSPLALAEVAKRKGKQLFFYQAVVTDHKIYYQKVFPTQNGPLLYSFTQDLGDVIEDSKIPDDVEYFITLDIKRDDPDLVAVVEELGNRANSPYSKLKVVEIPDRIEYYINEYDGMETIEEQHRIWC